MTSARTRSRILLRLKQVTSTSRRFGIASWGGAPSCAKRDWRARQRCRHRRSWLRERAPSALRRAEDRPTEGDFAILRFLCAAEIIESDLWEQYAGFGGQASTGRPNDGQNGFYVSALENLDSDMPQYISDNTDDEESHQAFINGYLMSKGQRPVSLEPFRRLPPSRATGGGTQEAADEPEEPERRYQLVPALPGCDQPGFRCDLRTGGRRSRTSR